jgi:hypothetical protein
MYGRKYEVLSLQNSNESVYVYMYVGLYKLGCIYNLA